MKPLFTPGGLQEAKVKCVYCKVSVGLYWVLMSKRDFSVNRFLLKNIVSRKVVSFSDISAVNFIVGWNLLASFNNKSCWNL